MCSNLNSRLLAATAALTTALGFSTHTAGADSRYEMVSYVESVSGRRIAAGDYDGAIDYASKRLHSGDTESRLIERTNLCVAYTVTGNYAKARETCEAAIGIARHVDAGGVRSASRSGTETAKAMTNRGVLKAMTGDMAGAAMDFRTATAAIGAPKAPARNLARVEGETADRLAMTEAR